ncbi:hypothetical protein ACFSKU_16000 [Pontibacter silvestris]|uniref:Uncharacterized protein n=1 Tax=Pontibacter silvestris TaxID=2305183 RepID=A0ABW4X0F2_9BACT|nr:hypothetical protein [Pontibacter silvestris]MCC9135973.1 hypothetical protein [Pontibacter silvestris]
METNNWYNREYRDRNFRNRNDRNYHDRYQNDDRSIDRDAYRGAYRLDDDSSDRNKTTYNGSERRNDSGRHLNRYNQLTYEQDEQNQNSNQDYGYRQDWNNSYRNNRNDRDYNYNFGDNRHEYRQGDYDRHWDEQYRPSSGGYGTRFGGDRNNFDADYGPDHFKGSRDENYGNTAGSLSWGYNGIDNYDPDYNRSYNPLTGRQSYHGDYSTRHPDRGRSGRNGNNDDRY